MVYFYIQLGVCACVWGCPWVAIKWEKWNYSTCKPYFCKVEMVFEIYEENSVVLPLIFNWEKISPSCKDSVIDHRFPVVPSVHGVQRNMIGPWDKNIWFIYYLSLYFKKKIIRLTFSRRKMLRMLKGNAETS